VFRNPEDRDIKDILKKSKNIAVVGLSDNKERDSYRIAEYLKEKGYRIIPVNPAVDRVLGEKSYRDLASVPDQIDIVNVFRRSEFLPAVVEEALKIKPGCIWSQLGVVDEKSAADAVSKGVPFIMDRCIKIEHRRLLEDGRE
jgi:predicted CoA-binding protein